jgi:hypothetical protein
LRLVVEQFQMAGGAGHEEEDDVLRLGGQVGLFGGERIGRRAGDAAPQKLVERHGAKAEAAFLEEPAAGKLARGDALVKMRLAVHF